MFNNSITEQLIRCNTDTVSLFALEGRFIGKVVEIYDGDTCKIVLPYNNILCKFICRLSGIDAPEIKPRLNKENREDEIEKAIISRNRLIELCTDVKIKTTYSKNECNEIVYNNTKLINIECEGFDKYGRLLVVLYDVYNENNKNNKSFNTILIDEGLAYEYNGGTKK